MQGNLWLLTVFVLFVVGILLLDLLIIGKKSHEVSFREAGIWTGIWILLALGFAIFLRFFGEQVHSVQDSGDLQIVFDRYYRYLASQGLSFEQGLELLRKNITINYLAGYLIEESLSIDNLFIIMSILATFGVPKKEYKQVLFWGVLGAIVLRCLFIFAGAALINRFEWILYIFGIYLIYAGINMFRTRNKEKYIDPRDHWLVRMLSGRFNVYSSYKDGRFFIREAGVIYMTPLFIVLIMVEFTDLIFAFDSIPAVFGVTQDPYIVFFSNIFAVLGLRSLFFLLVKLVEKFHLLKAGVSVLLAFIGIKLIFHDKLEQLGFRSVYSLYFIIGVLTISIVLSLFIPGKKTDEQR